MTDDSSPSEDGIRLRTKTVERNGLLACAACEALLCVVVRNKRGLREGITHHELQPQPAADVDRVVCAGCGALLWPLRPLTEYQWHGP